MCLGGWWKVVVTRCLGLCLDGLQGLLVGLASCGHARSHPALLCAVPWPPGLFEVHRGPSIFGWCEAVGVLVASGVLSGVEGRFQRASTESIRFRMGGEYSDAWAYRLARTWGVVDDGFEEFFGFAGGGHGDWRGVVEPSVGGLRGWWGAPVGPFGSRGEDGAFEPGAEHCCGWRDLVGEDRRWCGEEVEQEGGTPCAITGVFAGFSWLVELHRVLHAVGHAGHVPGHAAVALLADALVAGSGLSEVGPADGDDGPGVPGLFGDGADLEGVAALASGVHRSDLSGVESELSCEVFGEAAWDGAARFSSSGPGMAEILTASQDQDSHFRPRRKAQVFIRTRIPGTTPL